jgi:hypothetical protein
MTLLNSSSQLSVCCRNIDNPLAQAFRLATVGYLLDCRSLLLSSVHAINSPIAPRFCGAHE